MAQTADPRKDGDTDDRFTGVADASAFAAAVEELAALSRRPGWVTEEPELHLVPHLRSANVEGLRLVECQTTEDGALDITAEYRPDDGRRDIRRRAWALLGAIAEPAASVREYRDGDAVVFEVVTGIPDGSGPFASHGHSVRFILLPGGYVTRRCGHIRTCRVELSFRVNLREVGRPANSVRLSSLRPRLRPGRRRGEGT